MDPREERSRYATEVGRTEDGSGDEQRDQTIEFPTATGKVAIDVDSFIGDVVNSVNDWVFRGFNDMEQYILQNLGSKRAENPQAINLVVDNVFSKVQNDVDDTFIEWESKFRERIVKVAAEHDSRRRLQNHVNKNLESSIPADDQEQALDSELASLRSQIITASRGRSKMRREIANLQMQLSLKRDVANSIEAMDTSTDAAELKEIVTSASDLMNAISKARKCQDMSRPSATIPPMESCVPELETHMKPFLGEIFDSLTLDKSISVFIRDLMDWNSPKVDMISIPRSYDTDFCCTQLSHVSVKNLDFHSIEVFPPRFLSGAMTERL